MEWLKKVFIDLPSPYYTTSQGAAFLGNALELLDLLEPDSIDLIMTSPPFALQRRKEYQRDWATGAVPPEKYIEWFMAFVPKFHKVLKRTGSLVIHLGGSWNKNSPTKTLYNFELAIAIARSGLFHFIQDFYWFNNAKLPTPAQWVAVKRIRIKDAVDPIWWFAKTTNPKADNRKVLKPYSASMRKLLEKGYKPGKRPSGHDISDKFANDHGGAIPPNLLEIPNTNSNSYYLRACRAAGLKPCPARYPVALPSFFISFLTDPEDLVLDPFGGSNTTGEAAEKLGRRWLCFEICEEYLKGSWFRFLPLLRGNTNPAFQGRKQ